MFIWVCVFVCLPGPDFLSMNDCVCAVLYMSKEWFMFFHSNISRVIVVKWRHVYSSLSVIVSAVCSLWMEMEFKVEQATLQSLLLKIPLGLTDISSEFAGPSGRSIIALVCCQRPALSLCFKSIYWPAVYDHENISRVLQSSRWPPSLMTWAIKASLIHTVREWGWEWCVCPHTATTAMSSMDPDFYIYPTVGVSVTVKAHYVSLWDWLKVAA